MPFRPNNDTAERSSAFNTPKVFSDPKQQNLKISLQKNEPAGMEEQGGEFTRPKLSFELNPGETMKFMRNEPLKNEFQPKFTFGIPQMPMPSISLGNSKFGPIRPIIPQTSMGFTSPLLMRAAQNPNVGKIEEKKEEEKKITQESH